MFFEWSTPEDISSVTTRPWRRRHYDQQGAGLYKPNNTTRLLRSLGSSSNSLTAFLSHRHHEIDGSRVSRGSHSLLLSGATSSGHLFDIVTLYTLMVFKW